MPIDDQQLDELLRDVSVPRELKTSLLRISNEDSKTGTSRRSARLATIGLIASIAATILVIFSLRGSHVPIHDDVDVAANRKGEVEMLESLLNQAEASVDLNRQLIAANELEQSRLKLIRRVPRLELDESLALAMSVSWQSSIDRGSSIENVRSELEYVSKTFPGTRGANLAQHILHTN